MYQTTNQPIQFSSSRVFILGVTSLIMSLSLFMSAFAPLPLAIVSVACGRAKGMMVGLGFLVLSFFISVFVFKSVMSFGVFAFVFVVSILISEVERLQLKPIKGVFIAGTALVLLFVGLGTVTLAKKNTSLKNYILTVIEDNKVIFDNQKKVLEEKGNTKEAFEALSVLSQPKLLADLLAKEIPSYIIVSSYFLIWMNLFLLFRSRSLFNPIARNKQRDLINIRLPDFLIWPVIVFLLMMLWGDKLGEIYPVVGTTGLKALGVFYFFQGFGIYIQFLNYVGMRGFFRTMLLVFTLLTASYLIALIGLFDMFFNFRKYFVKKENN